MYGGDLAIPEAGGIQQREALHVVTDGVGFGKKRLEGFRTMEGEHPPGAVFDIIVIGEAGQLSRGFIGKADAIVDAYVFEGAVGIPSGLCLHFGDRLAEIVLFCFDHSDARCWSDTPELPRRAMPWDSLFSDPVRPSRTAPAGRQ